MAQFDSKSFNEKAFKYAVDRVPNLKMNEIKKSKALTGNPDIKAVFASQNGTGYAKIAMRGLIDGDAVNYDGGTDIEATSTKTFERGVVVVGRAKAWIEKDFSYDITGGVDFMQNVAEQVAEYKDGLDQDTIIAIMKGIFAMSTGAKNKEFVTKHTYDVSDMVDGNCGLSTLNSATNKACGANKKKFTMVFVHSDVATNLENKRLVEHLKYTDKDGVTRDLELYTWNGKLVIVDDEMPTETIKAHYIKCNGTVQGALKAVANDVTTANANEIKISDTKITGIVAGEYVYLVEDGLKYTSYVLGTGSIDYEDIGAKVPYEMSRDPKTNGGQDTLYTRQRKVFAPFGLSYEKKSQASLSPTDEELANGANWSLVCTGEDTEAQRSYINHKAIPICRIVSRG